MSGKIQKQSKSNLSSGIILIHILKRNLTHSPFGVISHYNFIPNRVNAFRTSIADHYSFELVIRNVIQSGFLGLRMLVLARYAILATVLDEVGASLVETERHTGFAALAAHV